MWFHERCANRLQPFEVVIKSEPVQIKYDLKSSYKDLQTEVQGKTLTGEYAESNPLSEPEWYFIVNNEPQVIISTAGNENNCGRGKIDITVSLEDPLIRIPKELPKDSCSFRYVLAHKLKHIETSQFYLEDKISEFNNEIKKSLNNRIIYATSPQSVFDKLNHYTETEILGYIKKELSKVADIHSAIDDPDQPLSHDICDGELRALIKG